MARPLDKSRQRTSSGRFNLNRAQVVDENFTEFVRNRRNQKIATPRLGESDPIVPDSSATCRDIIEMFESQIVARHQDIAARQMRARQEGFYTISSAGHEGNAALGRVTRHTDIAFIHYRSGAFMAERARKLPQIDSIRDTMLSIAASKEDPIAGGRHKVWGNVELCVPPQTSTIASHLPKAVGAAVALVKAGRLPMPLRPPPDSIVICSFGDASVNHATAQTAFNAALHAAYQRLPVPILWVCEDNGIGISVETPSGWIEKNYSQRFGLKYVAGNGLDLVDAYQATVEAVDDCRRRRRPVFLHLKMVRLLGHAGSDAETEYRSWQQIHAAEAKDPLLSTARLVIESGAMTADEVLDLYEDVRRRVRQVVSDVAHTQRLSTAAEIIKPLAPLSPDKVQAEARRSPPHDERVRVFGGLEELPERAAPRHMAVLLSHALCDLLIQYPEALVFGEDVAKKGGVYHVTAGLTEKFGAGRVFNTILDETSILGLAIGAGHMGMLPIPEIQYLAYYHNAQDQIRGEACSLQFFSNDQFRNPMVIRIAGWAYQKGFGGHFHNDNSITALRDVPGLIIATPSRGDDAVKMLRTCLAMAKVDGRVIAFIEPIALYMTKDLYAPKDQEWSFAYPAPGQTIRFGEAAVYHEDAGDVTILTFANGTYMSLRAARTLQRNHGIAARVVDLRWLNPLNEEIIVKEALATGRVLVVDEGRRTGGISEAILALLYEKCGCDVRAARLTADDTYIPLGPAADCVLPTEDDIVDHTIMLMHEK